MSANHSLSVLVLSLAATHAHADGVDDFSTGTSVRLDVGIVVVNTPRTSTGARPVAKPRATLDFAMRAEELGIDVPVTVKFRGRALGGGWIEYVIDDTYPRPIELGEGRYLSRIAGRVFMRATPVRGSEQQTYGNTRLVLAGMSYVVAHGDWGELLVPITRLDLRGGVPQPALARFSPAGTLACSNPEQKTYFPFSISLAGEATGSGASVELHTPRAAGVHLPPAALILPTQRTAVVNAIIQPGFVGTTRVTASLGGVVQSLDLVVRPCERL